MKNSWLKKNTFHYSKFKDLNRLVKEKNKKKLTISLCLPTLNEEKTIAKEIIIIKSELMTRYPLVDEIVVVDSSIQTAPLMGVGHVFKRCLIPRRLPFPMDCISPAKTMSDSKRRSKTRKISGMEAKIPTPTELSRIPGPVMVRFLIVKL